MSNVQSVERAFTLLEALADYPDGVQISRLSEKVGLTKSTVHRLLATLISLNYVQKDPASEKYKLGYRLVHLSRNIINDIDIISVAKPALEALAKDVNETIHLCIEDNGEVLYIDKIESNQTIRMISKVGNRAPMYCTGVGKMLLSGKNREQFIRLVRQMSFELKTANTITNAEQLAGEIEEIRRQGYTLDDIEHEDGIRCIAAPIFDSEGNLIASFSIAGPSNRVTIDLIEKELKAKILDTSMEISMLLGYQGKIPAAELSR